jgi:hypothetical protein
MVVGVAVIVRSRRLRLERVTVMVLESRLMV